MTRAQAHRRRERRGWLSGMKRSGPKNQKTPLWQWVLGVPLVLLVGAGILLFMYFTFFDPDSLRNERTVRAEVIERVEKTLPDGGLDRRSSYIVVTLEGREIRLSPHDPDWGSVMKGDSVDVRIVSSPGGGVQVLSWARVRP